jgi:DNA-directed RNA polymerase alpha subunit
MTGVNEKHLKISKQVFGGNLGAEPKLQNDAIMAILIRQDAIIESMNIEQRAAYDKLVLEHQDFLTVAKNNALAKYNIIQTLRKPKPIIEE